MIDGFLDISIPMEQDEGSTISPQVGEPDERRHWRRSRDTNVPGNARGSLRKQGRQRHLFTVKRGGIAGYLGAFVYLSIS